MAEEYNPYVTDTEENLTRKYAYIYTSMYDHKNTDIFGREKPFEFLPEFTRYCTAFGIQRSLSGNLITTPYFIAPDSSEINSLMTTLWYKIDFEWQNDNTLAKLSKIQACISAIQPLNDGNHRAGHAMAQYYLGQSGLPAIVRKKFLEEHNLAFSIAEKTAIVDSDLNDLILYNFYNILERQHEICDELNIPQDKIFAGKFNFPIMEDKPLQ